MRIISGTAKGRKILSPKSMVTRPTLDRIKESIFNIIQTRVRDSVVVDIFAGTGSLGLEAASRGAQKVYLVDRDDITFSLLNENVQNLKLQNICKCCKGDSYNWLNKFSDDKLIFDLIFIDPPYAKKMIPPALDVITKGKLLKRKGLIVCKIDSKEKIYMGNDKIILCDKRKYGNTTVIFYKYKGE